MNTLELKEGFATEYDDMTLWVENPEEGAKAYHITVNGEGTYDVIPCQVTKVIKRSDLNSEEEYSEACDELLGESEGVATGEFFTFDDCYYIEIDSTSDSETYDDVAYEDVEFS